MTTFEQWESPNLSLKENILRGIYNYGYETPSSIQRKAIIPITKGKDIIAQSQSGTGKTGAYLIGALQHIQEDVSHTQAVVLLPTRELAIQTHKVCNELARYTRIKSYMLIGGTSLSDNIEFLKSNRPQIIIGCVGRIHDMIQRNLLYLDTCKLFIMDEADEMLSIGFKSHIQNIFSYLHQDVQVLLFSATLPLSIKEITSKFMRDPVEILVEAPQLSLDGIQQYKLFTQNDHQKYEYIKSIFRSITMSQCIIYCNSVKRVCDLYDAMKEDEFPVTFIHSNMNYRERQRCFNQFLHGKYRILISSDLTARGIDIQQISLVINFDIPFDKHVYIHRIGRSGRWGRKGCAINFVCRRDQNLLYDIEQWYKLEMEEFNTSQFEEKESTIET